MPDGDPVFRHRISGGGLTAHVLSYGAVLQDLRLEGHGPPLVLGFEDLDAYLTRSPYFGAIAGRCANRIGFGRFEIDGESFQAERNFQDTHTLHGGSKGTGKSNWTVEAVEQNRITLSIDLADGEMGFPGNMHIEATYACLADGVLDIRMEARTDAPTLCNLAHHSYWNLDGAPDTAAHRMKVMADRYTVVDAAFIPTGEPRDVAGTRFDFRESRPIADDKFIDHNLCLSNRRDDLRPVAWLRSENSGVEMEIRTTESGLQVYDGYKLDIDVPGLEGRRYGPNAGVALEPQVWPDAINHSGFPNVLLRPSETYTQHTQFVLCKGIPS
ncbi:MAG: galactose mutarotase [Litoreibacter sp.]|nr:galactose mutarotase [Litoreibacter sp.]